MVQKEYGIKLPLFDFGGYLIFPVMEEVTGQLIFQKGIVRFFVDVVSALVYLHKQSIIHMDMCFSNVLWDGRRFVLSDLGLSQLAGTVLDHPCGHWEFMSGSLQHASRDSLVECNPELDAFECLRHWLISLKTVT
jgi:tRNA A-37 threonylcarbamoyl transferase component Bud32